MNKNLLILGAGQYGKVAKEIAEAMCCFEKIDFLDDNSELAIGKLNEYEEFSTEYSYAIVAIGNSKLRLELVSDLEKACFKIAILVHPRAIIAPSAQIMKGSIVEPSAVVNTGSIISCGCIVSAGAVVNHNAMCCDGVHVDCNATVAANAVVPAGLHILSNTFYKNENIKAEDLFFGEKSIAINPESSGQTAEHGPLPVNGLEYCFEDGM